MYGPTNDVKSWEKIGMWPQLPKFLGKSKKMNEYLDRRKVLPKKYANVNAALENERNFHWQ